MPLTAENAALQIQDRLKDIQRYIHQIDDERRRSETNINSLSRAQQSNMPVQKMKSLYKACLQDAVVEEDTIRKALEKIQEIRNIRNERRIQARNAGNKEAIRRGALMKMVQISAQTLPLFVSKPGEKVPPLCGAIPAESNYIAKVGDNVAALVKGVEEEENWILAEVVSFLQRQNKYDVIDIDEEQKDRHVLSKRKVIPLPLMRANPETDGHALFPKDTVVMALYPQTTCFYKAIIHRLPQTATEDYEVLFEDSSYTNGYAEPLPVAQRYVIVYKSTKKSGSTGGGSGSVSSSA
ncbi:SAGA-associated factor 29 isoform X1 [Stomoxys calcitrans]|uniref:SGF29 C-terminal domain-containing protein n=2 Tax=Stomoxys calcitrans TaxID=35570 RepID=A0A1I8Q9S7_STOCA|nr:SAGA-associated factor 29 isoform X1 [Stomoxys calcitrans]